MHPFGLTNLLRSRGQDSGFTLPFCRPEDEIVPAVAYLSFMIFLSEVLTVASSRKTFESVACAISTQLDERQRFFGVRQLSYYKSNSQNTSIVNYTLATHTCLITTSSPFLIKTGSR